MTSTAVAQLETIRELMLPMLQIVAEEYRPRTPDGYPVLVDAPERGAIGIQLDPSHSLHIVSDGSQLYADLTARASRTDARSSASREKYSGQPFNDHRPIDTSISPVELRNLISELLNRWNMQPTIIHITDT